MNELLRRLLFLPLQRSTVAKEIDLLHYFVISVTLAGSVLVFLMATIYVIRYRRPSSDSPPRPNVHAAEHYPRQPPAPVKPGGCTAGNMPFKQAAGRP